MFSTLACTLLITLTNVPSSFSIDWLDVTVTTDKPSYTYRSLVTIYGKLWLNGNPRNGVVGVEVVNPNNQTLIIRSVPAGTPTLSNIIEFVEVIPCDQYGNPKYDFKKGNFAHVKVKIKSNDVLSSRHVIITVVAYDNDSTPILPNVNYLETDILPNSTIEYKPDFFLYSWISTGTAKFYVCVFSDWPRKGGLPYTLEQTAQFTITSTSSLLTLTFNKEAEPKAESNMYSLNFRLPPNEESGAPFGNYTVYVSADSQGYTGKNTASFKREYQIIGDTNFDHKIDVLDVVTVTSKYGLKSGDLGWNPEVDVKPSGKIDISDVVVVTQKYGQKY
jgi:hypothetical protein